MPDSTSHIYVFYCHSATCSRMAHLCHSSVSEEMHQKCPDDAGHGAHTTRKTERLTKLNQQVSNNHSIITLAPVTQHTRHPIRWANVFQKICKNLLIPLNSDVLPFRLARAHIIYYYSNREYFFNFFTRFFTSTFYRHHLDLNFPSKFLI